MDDKNLTLDCYLRSAENTLFFVQNCGEKYSLTQSEVYEMVEKLNTIITQLKDKLNLYKVN